MSDNVIKLKTAGDGDSEQEEFAEIFIAYLKDGSFCVAGDREEAIEDLQDDAGNEEFRVVRVLVSLPEFADEEITVG